VPFLLLLSRDLKRNARLLGRLAAGMLLVRLVDLFWLVAPDLQGHHGTSLSVHWLDLAAPLGLGGIWLFAFTRELKTRPLLPQRDPELDEFMAAPAHGGH
jgi:hypothetical protein